MSQRPQQPKPTRRRRSGASLGWDDAAIEQAATVGPQDADAAEVSWNRFSPKAARGLLSAVEVDDERDTS